MAKQTTYERVKSDLAQKGKVMVKEFKKTGSLRNQLYKLKKEGWELKRIGERGDIKGYQLIQTPEECQQ